MEKTIFKTPNPMWSWINPMLKCKIQSVWFILEYKYAQTHRKTLIFSMTMELNYLKLDIHTHKMLELRKFVKLLWIKPPLCVWDWSLVCWPHIPTNQQNWKHLQNIHRFHILLTLSLLILIFDTYPLLGTNMSCIYSRVWIGHIFSILHTHYTMWDYYLFENF